MRPIDLEGLTAPAWRDPGPKPALAMIDIALLVIDPEYQRPIGKDGRKAIEKIAAEFEWTKFSTVVVAPVSDGRYAIIDGQHRTTAAALCGIKDVPCQIVPLDRAGQAAAFSAINGSVTRITTWHIYKAALAAGTGWATRAHRAVEAAGCALMTYNKSASAKEPGEIYAVNLIRDLVERHGEDLVTLALKAYRLSIYGNVPVAWGAVYVQAWIVAVSRCPGAVGMSAEALAAFHERFDVLEADDRVVERLREQRRDGKPAPARWDALCDLIVDELQAFVRRRGGV